MRAGFLVALASLALAQAPPPQKVVFARVFPQPGQIGLFIAAADGSNEHPLVTQADIDYDAGWAPDGASIVFTSERGGSADLYRVRPDGTSLERLTDSPSYDDQAAFSPDGRQLVFVSTRAGGTADLWTMDLQTRRTKALTSGPGGDFRPAWSPDGQWIAFSSDRTSNLPFAHGRWEHLQLADLYIVHPDGSNVKRLTSPGGFCGSPKWTADSRRVVAYCMTAEQTLDNRRAAPEHPEDTRIVSVDINTGQMSDLPAGRGVKFNPSILSGDVLAYIRRDGDERGIHYSNGRRGPAGEIRTAAWSPDGTQVVFHKRVAFQRKPWVGTWSRNPQYELTLTSGGPSFSPTGDRFAFVGPATNAKGAGVAVAEVGSETSRVIYADPIRNVLGPQWSPNGDRIIFGIGVFDAFFNGFHGLFLKPADRVEGGAQVAMVNADGSGFRELTSGPNNSGFPSMSPDGRRFVYRTFGPDGDGLRIMDIETKQVTPIASGYDNFPLWSPRGDLIMFSRQAEGDYEIYTIKPDGTGLRRLTHSRGNDAHMAWSPDGGHIVFASTRMGFKDEVPYTDAPQPYGEIFVMRADGSDLQQLTDNQWEDGTPAWRPTTRAATGAAEAHVMISAGFFAVYSELGPAFERATGHRLVTTRGPSMGDSPDAIPTRLARGEVADVVILDGGAADELGRRGLVRSDTKVELAGSLIGMVVRAGTAKPDIGSVEKFRSALLAAKSIAFSDSASGTYLSTVLFAKLGVADQVAGKSRKVRGPPSGEPVAAVVARGEAEIGFQQVSELIHVPGITFVGTIPAELQPVTVFAAVLTTTAREPEAATALIRFLASKEAAPVIVKAGLTPLRR